MLALAAQILDGVRKCRPGGVLNERHNIMVISKDKLSSHLIRKKFTGDSDVDYGVFKLTMLSY